MQAVGTAVEAHCSDRDDGFDRLCDAGRMLPAEEVARFACPPLDDPSMLWGSAEFCRWFMADGAKRSRPLDYEELVEFICMRDRCSRGEAEREVCLHSRARKGDQEVWSALLRMGYLDFADIFAEEEFGQE